VNVFISKSTAPVLCITNRISESLLIDTPASVAPSAGPHTSAPALASASAPSFAYRSFFGFSFGFGFYFWN